MSTNKILAVHSVTRFVFTVQDLASAEKFYTTFGLDVRRTGDRLELRTFGHEHIWAYIYQANGVKKLQYVSFGVYPDDLAAFSERAERLGIAGRPHSLSEGEGLWLTGPDGIPIHLEIADKVSPCSATEPSVEGPRVVGQGAAPSRSKATQVRPRYLSHILLFSPDVTRMVDFCKSVLGLRLSDHSGDLIAFLHTPHGSDHHLVAFAKSSGPGLHHSSWDVGSVDEVGRGAEQMRNAGWAEGWGVGRHVLGSNFFNYVKDPWGSFCEYSCGIDYVPAGLEWPAQDHPPEDSLYVWGPSVPSDFITNHEQA